MDERETTEVAKLTQMKSKVNRLRRSPKSATQNLARICQTAEFKTPTRPARGQFRRVIPEDSPSNDPDSHQDIIWDTTSPIRHGRGHRRPANVRSVDISDIANRIAPKNGRLEEADSSLLQWIGDSAIPCTPEVQLPKVKSMSTKLSTVEDLMRLAKQFDFNMRQDEAQEPHEPGSKSAVLAHFDNPTTTIPNGFALKSENVGSGNAKPVYVQARCQEMDDDLDLLFDGPTQQLSGRLSQISGRTQDVPQRATEKNLAAVKACDSVATCDDGKQVNNADGFEDDWTNDSFFEDSLVFEMTQNPDFFVAPRGCSTQKQNGDKLNAFSRNMHSDAIGPKPQEAKNGLKCATTQGENVKKRQTFQLETSHAGHQAQAKPYGGLQRPGNHMEGNFTSPSTVTSKALTVPPSHGKANQNQQYQHLKASEIQKPQVVQNSSVPNNVSLMCFQSNTKETPVSTGPCTIQPSHSKPASTHQSLNPGVVKQKVQDAITGKDGFNSVSDEDLDSFFASDDIWDEGIEDDDLFCEACDNLEVSGNQQASKTQTKAAQSNVSQNKTEMVFAHPNPPRKPPTNVSLSSANTSTPLYRPKTHNVNSGPVGVGLNVLNETAKPSGPSSNGPYKFTQVGRSSAVASGTGGLVRTQQGQNRGVLATLQSDVRTPGGQQIQKSYILSNRSAPVVNKEVCNKAALKCSDAEIERKKQQALERRRLRMMSNQNLRAPV